MGITNTLRLGKDHLYGSYYTLEEEKLTYSWYFSPEQEISTLQGFQ